MKEYTIFIFRRDFRLDDNNGLFHALTEYKDTTIIPIFIFTPEQINRKENQYRSDNGVQFMIESLRDLNKQLTKLGSKLYLFYGDNVKVLTKLVNKINSLGSKNESRVKAIVFNKDYTPYARKRDNEIEFFCKKYKNQNSHNTGIESGIGITCDMVEDYLMSDYVGQYNKASDGNPYTVFTPFKKNAIKKHRVTKPTYLKLGLSKYKKLFVSSDKSSALNIAINKIRMKTNWKKGLTDVIDYKINEDIQVRGGRVRGLDKLKQLKKDKRSVKLYDKQRNQLSYQTTELSAYIKFGCVSIREVYWFVLDDIGMKKDDTLISQLYWREFYYYIVYFYPKVLETGSNFNPKYDNIKWVSISSQKGMDYLEKWTQGRTGFPVVDAGMTQLNTTGYMHNRARLITANFLNRMLGLDWRLGERYFAIKLTDYDPAVNNGNWQWVSSTGTDPKPYFQRLFNPIIQSKKFDVDAEYIKKWLPQLNDIPANHLHNWEKYSNEYDLSDIKYVAPIVDYKKARQRSIDMYRAVL